MRFISNYSSSMWLPLKDTHAFSPENLLVTDSATRVSDLSDGLDVFQDFELYQSGAGEGQPQQEPAHPSSLGL